MRSDIWWVVTTTTGFWTLTWPTRHCGRGQEKACWFQRWKNLASFVRSFDRSNNTGAIDVKIDGFVLEEKPSFKMLGLTFSSKLDWGSYIISIAKSASKKIGALVHSMKFLSLEVALYLYKSTKRPCIEYCCQVWADAPSCYMKLLDKLEKRTSRTVGPYLAGSFEPLAHRRSVSSLRLFYKYYFGRCSSGLAQLASLTYSQGRSTRYSDRLHGFSVTIQLDVKKMSISTASFIAQLDSGIHCL